VDLGIVERCIRDDARDDAGTSEEDYPIEEEEDRIRADAVLFCHACARGDAAALRVFEQTYGNTIRHAIARIGPEPAFVEEVMAGFLDRLLVGPPPRIASYAGRGELAAWLGVSASRAALDAKRAAKRLRELELDDGLAAATSMSPESLVFCREHARDAISALECAFHDLGVFQRTLLRLHYVDGFTADQIGDQRGVHRVTVARWLQKARGAIDRLVHAELSQRCRLRDEEIASLISGARAHLEERLRELLIADEIL
jgi:RNA polymerase sigma-70 factor, ECF subfamily